MVFFDLVGQDQRCDQGLAVGEILVERAVDDGGFVSQALGVLDEFLMQEHDGPPDGFFNDSLYHKAGVSESVLVKSAPRGAPLAPAKSGPRPRYRAGQPAYGLAFIFFSLIFSFFIFLAMVLRCNLTLVDIFRTL